MATAVVTVAITETGIHRSNISPGNTLVPVTFTIAAGDYVNNGLSAEITGYAIKTSKAPIAVFVFPRKGFTFDFTIATNKLVGFVAVDQQLDAAAIPAGLVGVAIQGIAIFPNA